MELERKRRIAAAISGEIHAISEEIHVNHEVNPRVIGTERLRKKIVEIESLRDAAKKDVQQLENDIKVHSWFQRRIGLGGGLELGLS